MLFCDFISHCPYPGSCGSSRSICHRVRHRSQTFFRRAAVYTSRALQFRQSSFHLVMRVLRGLTLQRLRALPALLTCYVSVCLSALGKSLTQECPSQFLLSVTGILQCVRWRTRLTPEPANTIRLEVGKELLICSDFHLHMYASTHLHRISLLLLQPQLPQCRSNLVLHQVHSRVNVVSTVILFDRQRWTKAVFAALFLFSLSAILHHSSRLGKRVMTERACCLNRAPVGPTRAPPLSRVRSCANGPGLDHRGCPPQPSPIRRIAGQGVINRSVACAAANEIHEKSYDAH
jgi:hypothetical protein